MPLPSDANIMPLLWTYMIKPNGIKKARCVCNGSPRQKGSIILGKTYAAALEQSGCRLFYALSALNNYYIKAADATNAYTEAPPPVATLYVKVDKPYREWYLRKYNKLIPEGYVLPVQHTLQGHPESARLWSSYIHDILVEKYNFVSCPHETCLYSGFYNQEHIYFLRQVDDFAISSHHQSTIDELL